MVREMRAEELDQVMEIWLDTNLRAHNFIPGQVWQAWREAVRKLLPQAEVLVCEEGGGLLGFCGLSGDCLEGLFVRYGAQSRGVGRELLNAARDGRDCLTLRVYQKNTRAAAFYRREGFVVQSEGLDENTGEAELEMRWERRPDDKGMGGHRC